MVTRIGTGPAEGPAPKDDAAQARPTMDPADVHAMRAAMAEDQPGESLSSLFSRFMGADKTAPEQGAEQVREQGAAGADPDGGRDGQEQGAEPSPQDIAAEVAERVLVTDKDFSDNDEVRIYLKDSVLADTEIHLKREPGGLEVRVQTGDRAAHEVLLDAKDALAARLEACCEGRVLLEIVFIRKEF